MTGGGIGCTLVGAGEGIFRSRGLPRRRAGGRRGLHRALGVLWMRSRSLRHRDLRVCRRRDRRTPLCDRWDGLWLGLLLDRAWRRLGHHRRQLTSPFGSGRLGPSGRQRVRRSRRRRRYDRGCRRERDDFGLRRRGPDGKRCRPALRHEARHGYSERGSHAFHEHASLVGQIGPRRDATREHQQGPHHQPSPAPLGFWRGHWR